jgi:hypothetical protein
MSYDAVKHLKSIEFKRLCGVRLETFESMLTVLRQAEIQKLPGRPSKLSLEDQLLMTLEYWREYRTYFHIGQSWGVNESTAYRIIRKTEQALSASRVFTLPGKKKLAKEESQIEVVIVDVTETPRLASKKKQRRFYSGKQKKHTFKSQVIVEAETRAIICIAHGKGRQHDFKLFKASKVQIKAEIELLGDKGYQGIKNIHGLSRTPQKKHKGSQLNSQDKKSNRKLARIRVLGEHVHRKLKVFKILSQRYRNRRKRFGLRFNLIAALYNYELRLPKLEVA